MHSLLWSFKTGISMLVALAMVVNLIILSSAEAGVNKWTTNGPEGGTIQAIAVAPSDPRIIYALTIYYYGTLFKSTDGGDSWGFVSDGLQLTSLIVDPGNPQVLYAIGIDFLRIDPPRSYKSVIKSVDGGQTWSATTLTFTGEYDLRILAISPVEPRILYAAVSCGLAAGDSFTCPGTNLDSPGVYRSVDDGESWTLTANAPGAEGVTRTETLTIDPHNSSIVYRGVIFYRVECFRPGFCSLNPQRAVLFKSIDRGEQWIPISTFPSRWISSLIIDPLNPQILYGGDGEHVFKSIDGGQSWTNSSAGLLGSLNSFSLVISPTNSQILYVRGAPDIFKTVDGGLTWVRINPGPRELFTQGTLVSPLAIDPQSPETLYSGYGDRGFLKSSDGGMQWSAHNTGLVATTISGLATTVADSRTVYAWSTSPPRLYVSTDGGKQWSDRSGAFNYSLYPDHVPPSVVVDSTDPQTLYIRTFSGVYRSSDGGQSWSARNTGFEGSSPFGVSNLAIDTQNPQTLYATVVANNTNYASLYKTTDGGQNWGRLAFPTNADPYLLVIDPINSQILYAVGREVDVNSPLSVLFVSVDGGQTWTLMSSTNLRYVINLIPAPSTLGLLYATSYQGLLKSTDGGATWIIVVADQFNQLVVDPTDAHTLYGMRYNADGWGSVFKSTDGGYTWNALKEGLTTTLNVQALVIDPTNPRILYAGTDGGGVFQIEQQPPISVTSISPNSGTTKGGTVVTINGENFLPGAVVTIGGAPATNVTVVNTTTLTATTPPGTAGTTNVVVVNPGCAGEPICSATLANAFTYVAPPPPAVQLTPSALDFGTVKIGKRRQLSFKIRNSGANDQTVWLSTSSPFSLRSSATVTLKPGKSTKVKVQFAPTAVETFTSTVVVTDPQTEGSLDVPVRGVGVGR